MKNLIAINYLPCVQWFSKLITDNAVIEQCENYSKGSYRNRCHIIGANGILPLSIPLLKGKNSQTSIKDVKISYIDDWQKLHWQSIQSAYGNAPFFEFYENDIKQHYLNNEDVFLFNFNLGLIHTFLRLMNIEKSCISFSNSFEKEPTDLIDFRNGISPKEHKCISDPNFEAMEYAQVFMEKFGFIENMSILDLLFCCGPEASYILEESYGGLGFGN